MVGYQRIASNGCPCGLSEVPSVVFGFRSSESALQRYGRLLLPPLCRATRRSREGPIHRCALHRQSRAAVVGEGARRQGPESIVSLASGAASHMSAPASNRANRPATASPSRDTAATAPRPVRYARLSRAGEDRDDAVRGDAKHHRGTEGRGGGRHRRRRGRALPRVAAAHPERPGGDGP